MTSPSYNNFKSCEKGTPIPRSLSQEFQDLFEQSLISPKNVLNITEIKATILSEQTGLVNVPQNTPTSTPVPFQPSLNSTEVTDSTRRDSELNLDSFIEDWDECNFNVVSVKAINEFYGSRNHSFEGVRIVRWDKLNFLKSQNTSNTKFTKLIDIFEPILEIKCTFCGKEFANGAALGGHTSKMHANEKTNCKKRKRIHKLRIS